MKQNTLGSGYRARPDERFLSNPTDIFTFYGKSNISVSLWDSLKVEVVLDGVEMTKFPYLFSIIMFSSEDLWLEKSMEKSKQKVMSNTDV